MAEIIPIVVENWEELSKAIKLKRTAILVNNEEMYSELSKSELGRKAIKFGKKASVATGIASLVTALFGPIGIFTASAYIFTASILTLGGSALAGISKGDLNKYKLGMLEEEKLIVLIKIKGSNSMSKKDTIKLPENLSK